MTLTDAEIEKLFDDDPLKLALELLVEFPIPPATVHLGNLRGDLDLPSRPASSVRISRMVAEALHILVTHGYVAPALENWDNSPLWVFVTSKGVDELQKREGQKQ
jgi:hypothetical protein